MHKQVTIRVTQDMLLSHQHQWLFTPIQLLQSIQQQLFLLLLSRPLIQSTKQSAYRMVGSRLFKPLMQQ